MRCDACQYWQKPEGDEWEPVKQIFGKCDRTPHIEDMTKWSETEDDYLRVLVPEMADRTAFAQDTSGYHAWLRTKPEHFCAMFKPI